MSVLVRRLIGPPKLNEHDGILFSNLSKFKIFLDIALEEAPSPIGKFYDDIVLLALAIVNSVLSNIRLLSNHQSIALQAARAVLSVISTFQRLIPNVHELTERDYKYANALSVDVQLMCRLLSNILEDTARGLHASLPLHPVSPHRGMQLKRSLEAFERKASNFMVDPDLGRRRKERQTREGAEAHILEWSDVKLSDKIEPARGFQDDLSSQNTFRAEVLGNRVLVKNYSLTSFKTFQRDLEVLKKHRHANLSPLFGHSKAGSSAPFIVISADSVTVPLPDYISKMSRNSPQLALGEVWKMFIDVRYTAEYLFLNSICCERAHLSELLGAATVRSSGRVVITPSSSALDRDRPGRVSVLTDFLQEVSEFYDSVFGMGGPYLEPRSIADRHIRKKIPPFLACFPYGLCKSRGRPLWDFQARQAYDRISTVEHWSNFRPLENAMRSNPLGTLHSSFARLTDLKSQKAALNRWRVAVDYRDEVWPIIPSLTFQAGDQPAVGDLGKYSPGTNGQPTFVKFTNLQTQLGGYYHEVEFGERLNGGIWCRPINEFSEGMKKWGTHVRGDLALDYLSTNGRQLAGVYGVAANELVLVTTVHFYLDEDPPDQYRFVYAHFGMEGRLSECYWSHSPSPHDQTSIYPPGLRPINILSLMNIEVRCVQIEEDELRGVDDEGHSFARRALLGDIGYDLHILQASREFRVLHNFASESTTIEALEGSSWTIVDRGYWHSPPIQTRGISQVCYAWMATASIGLPIDLEKIFLYRCLSLGHQKKIPESARCGVVKQVVHLLQATVPESDFPLHLFVSFSHNGQPDNVIWSADHAPPKDPTAMPGPIDWKVLSYPILTQTVDFALLSPSPWKHSQLEDIEHSPPLQGSEASLAVRRTGDIGYWERDDSGAITDRWVGIGRVICTPSSRELKHIVPLGQSPCIQVSKGLWRSEGFTDLSVAHVARYSWLEGLPAVSPRSLQALSERLANQFPEAKGDILIITQVTAHVIATSFPSTSRREDSGQQFTPRVYISLPSDGGCYTYWSSHPHSTVNAQLLPILDLEACSLVPGCSARKSFDVLRHSLDTLCSRGGPSGLGSPDVTFEPTLVPRRQES